MLFFSAKHCEIAPYAKIVRQGPGGVVLPRSASAPDAADMKPHARTKREVPVIWGGGHHIEKSCTQCSLRSPLIDLS